MKEAYVHRFCPCFGWDPEGIQSWLESMGARGLHLEPDGAFLGIFSFRKGEPRSDRYRLTPIREKRGFFPEDDGPDPEEEAFSRSCGWEYLLRYGAFYIYRATDPATLPLHTDPAVHALALQGLQRTRNRAVLSQVIFWGVWLWLRGSSTLNLFRTGATLGPVYLMSLLGLLLCLLVSLIALPVALGRLRKRLRAADPLETPVDWKRKAPGVYLAKALPWVLGLLLVCSLGRSWHLASVSVSLEALEKPFPGACDLFPEEEPERLTMGDYNTGVAYGNFLSENLQWNESCSLGQYHCILRIQCYDLRAPWLARGLEEELYRQEMRRYRGKRFLDLETPETELDSLRVYSSYGVVHVLLRQGTLVMDAVVSVSAGDGENQWWLWLEAAEEWLRK